MCDSLNETVHLGHSLAVLVYACGPKRLQNFPSLHPVLLIVRTPPGIGMDEEHGTEYTVLNKNQGET